MILFGHPLFESPSLYAINSIEAIKQTPSNALLYVEYSKDTVDIVQHMKAHGLHFALQVNSLKEVIFAHNFQATYIVVNDGLASLAQKAADEYIFDAKILCQISNEESIETLATLGVDGAMFANALVKSS